MQKPEVALVRLLTERNMTVSAAESCTGGMIAARLVGVPGASVVFPGAIVSYQTRVKESLLGVDPATVARHTVVSEDVAREMAAGAARALGTDCAVSVTGLAGPGGGTEEIPVGRVFVGWYVRGDVTVGRFDFPGDRDEVRSAAADAAIAGLLDLLTKDHR